MSEETLLQKIYNNPYIQGSIVLFESSIPIFGPAVAAGRKAAEQALSNDIKEKQATYMDELHKSGIITQEMFEKSDFIHCFIVTHNAMLNTRNQNKIRRFARILLSAIEKDELASDRFEECVKICEQLAEIELVILKAVLEAEQEIGDTRGINHTKIKDLWDTFQQKLSLSSSIIPEELQSRIFRLESYGLYETVGIGMNLGGPRQVTGRTTTLFKDFAEWIKLENEKLNADE